MRLAIDLRLRNYNAKKWTPKKLSPKLWLSADAGVTLNGSNVSAWADQSGNGNHFSQGTAGNQPLYLSSATSNGKPAISFAGGGAGRSEYLSGTPFFGTSNESSVIAVVKAKQGNNQNMIFSHTKTGSPYNGIEMAFDGGSPTAGGLGRYTGSWSWSTNKLPLDLDFAVGGVYGLKDASGYIRAGINGNSYADIYSGNTSTILDGNTGVVSVMIGRAPSGSGIAKVEIAEIVVYDKLLTTNERAKLIAYLKAKYGIV